MLFDPLGQGVELPLVASHYPYGFPLRIESNSELILCAAAESWSCWRERYSEPPICLRIAVSEQAAAALPPVPAFRAQQHVLAAVSDADNFAVCDLRSGAGFAWLTRRTAAERGFVRYHFLEAMAYSILAQLYVTAVHAGCVARGGRGIVLCGTAGSGKSCFAYACARKGWTFVCDDVLSIRRKGEGLELIGDAHQIRFRDSAVELFPELRGRAAVRSENGKPSVEVRTAVLAEISASCFCQAEAVVFLARRQGATAELAPVPATDAMARLVSELPLYESAVDEEQKDSLWRLLELPTFELRLGDLDAAVALLEQLL